MSILIFLLSSGFFCNKCLVKCSYSYLCLICEDASILNELFDELSYTQYLFVLNNMCTCVMRLQFFLNKAFFITTVLCISTNNILAVYIFISKFLFKLICWYFLFLTVFTMNVVLIPVLNCKLDLTLAKDLLCWWCNILWDKFLTSINWNWRII